jgi:hypothetical protein
MPAATLDEKQTLPHVRTLLASGLTRSAEMLVCLWSTDSRWCSHKFACCLLVGCCCRLINVWCCCCCSKCDLLLSAADTNASWELFYVTGCVSYKQHDYTRAAVCACAHQWLVANELRLTHCMVVRWCTGCRIGSSRHKVPCAMPWPVSASSAAIRPSQHAQHCIGHLLIFNMPLPSVWSNCNSKKPPFTRYANVNTVDRVYDATDLARVPDSTRLTAQSHSCSSTIATSHCALRLPVSQPTWQPRVCSQLLHSN